ncbi:SRPBCC family protein, partial [Patulibacter sp. S7RM1-6]
MRVTERIDLPVAPERAWAAIVEPRVVVRATPGLETFEAIDGGALRVGSRIRALMRVGAAELGSELEVTVLNPGSDLGATSVTGVDLQVGLRVRPRGDGARVTVHLGFTPPGGVT